MGSGKNSKMKRKIEDNKLTILVSDKEEDKSNSQWKLPFVILLLCGILIGNMIATYKLNSAHVEYENHLTDFVLYQTETIKLLEDNLYFSMEQEMYQSLPDGSRVYVNLPEYFNHTWQGWDKTDDVSVEIVFPDCLENKTCFVVGNNEESIELIKEYQQER